MKIQVQFHVYYPSICVEALWTKYQRACASLHTSDFLCQYHSTSASDSFTHSFDYFDFLITLFRVHKHNYEQQFFSISTYVNKYLAHYFM